MILDCCGQQRTFEKFFGLLAQRFCMIDRKYIGESYIYISKCNPCDLFIWSWEDCISAKVWTQWVVQSTSKEQEHRLLAVGFNTLSNHATICMSQFLLPCVMLSIKNCYISFSEPFQRMFEDQYSTCHRLETNKLRNVAKFFAHLLHSDAISWEVSAEGKNKQGHVL